MEWLRVCNGHLVGEQGRSITLRGMSLFWSQWMPQYYCNDTITWLAQDWGVSVIRCAIAVEHDGYLTYPDKEWKKLESVIQAAIDNDIYVIVDWHCHHPYMNEAKLFFKELATQYKDCPNLIFEIWNEPQQEYKWKTDIKPYHQEVLECIRSTDKRRIVILGTENYCQGVDIAARSPVEEDNIMYALHYYAASHKGQLQVRTIEAITKNLPVFVSEYGLCEADGDGIIDFEESLKWWLLLKTHGLSYVNWAVSNKCESSSILLPTCSKTSEWATKDLTPAGRFLRNHLNLSRNADLLTQDKREL